MPPYEFIPDRGPHSVNEQDIETDFIERLRTLKYTFRDDIHDRATLETSMLFDGEQLTELMEPLELGWKSRQVKEVALMDDLVPLLKKRAGGREISGLKVYEQ